MTTTIMTEQAQTTRATASTSQRYYLISLTRRTWAGKDLVTFWRPDMRGYTNSVTDAGRYTDREIITYHGTSSIAVPCEDVEALIDNDRVSCEHIDTLKTKAVPTGDSR